MKEKVLYLNSTLPIELKELTQSEPNQSIYIEGYASTCDLDRTGDIVSVEVWKTALVNYLKNPVILAYHDHDNPVGRMVDHRVDSTGLWVKARISAAAEVYNLVKDSVLTAFSIGFKVEDAEYDSESEIFMIKAIELVEISVVSIPCNQNTVFSLAKAFDNAEDYSIFKKQFTKATSVAAVESTTTKEWIMSPEEIKQMLEAATKQAAEQATKALLDKQEQELKEKTAKLQAEDELNARVEKAVAARVQTIDTGAERLLADVTKRIESETGNALEGLNAVIKEKAEELAKIQKSKMNFTDKANGGDVGYADRETAVLLGKITGKGIEGTTYGRNLVEKAGTGSHVAGTYSVAGSGSLWETEVSFNMENEIRRRLVVAPTLRSIAMQTNVMTIPLNPEAGDANWVSGTGTEWGTSASAGSQKTHTLANITLNAYKVATREYLNFEEEEDSLIILLPIIRDAMLRRTARSIDKALLRGAGDGGLDPVKGLASYATTSANTSTVGTASAVTVTALRTMRKNLGAWGLDPQELIFMISTEAYYDLLEDTTFQTMNQVGPLATLLTGQIGQIGGTPVLVSDQFATKGSGAVNGICFNPGNFILGNQRGLRVDTQDLIETQRRVLVASLRVGMTQISPTIGGVTNGGVAKLSWV